MPLCSNRITNFKKDKIVTRRKESTIFTANHRSETFGLFRFKISGIMNSSRLSLRNDFFSLLLLLLSTTTTMMMIVHQHNVMASQQSINLDQLGNYHGLVVGFSNDFRAIKSQYINTTLISIMNQLQKTSNILHRLIGVRIADVTILLPNQWRIDLDYLRSMQFNVHESDQYRTLSDADIIYTNDHRGQILTMQFGDCGEGSLPINFPNHYVSDKNSGKILAHQWLLYRYGVFNEFGFEDDFQYPIYYTPAFGDTSDSDNLLDDYQQHSHHRKHHRYNLHHRHHHQERFDENVVLLQSKPKITSCFQGTNPLFKYSNNCNNVTDPITGRPINPNCDVIPRQDSIQSSFMYAPMAVSELHLCNSTTHDYQAPTKHNIICDYQSIESVIRKHHDFERFKPNFRGPTNQDDAFDNDNDDDLNDDGDVVNASIQHSLTTPPLIRFRIIQNRNDFSLESSSSSSSKAYVLYALPKHKSRYLEASMDMIKKLEFFQHQALFALYGKEFHIVSGWRPSNLLSMIFMDNQNDPRDQNDDEIYYVGKDGTDVNDENHQNQHHHLQQRSTKRIDLNRIFQSIVQQFQNLPGSGAGGGGGNGGTCVLFFSGDQRIENIEIDHIELLADLLNRKNIRLKVILYDHSPTNEVLNFFDQLQSKLQTKSSIEYAFGSRLDSIQSQSISSSSPSSSQAFRTKLPSIINSYLFDLLQDLTEQTHILIRRETIRATEQNGIEFAIDPSIDHNSSTVLIEMSTNGKASDLALGFNLTDSNRKTINFLTFDYYERNIFINYRNLPFGIYRFSFRSTDPNTFITISVRILSQENQFRSYQNAAITAKCWIQNNPAHPLRGYVQVQQGLNGPIYDADVTFLSRSFGKANHRHETVFPSNDNGRGNPDITGHDGIFSAYLDPIFPESDDTSINSIGAHTIFARIVGRRTSMKPGNFGNTVMFTNKPRCCGSELKNQHDDQLIEHRFERIVYCGSIYHSIQSSFTHGKNYAIRDLRIISFDAQNRTISLEWNSPFYSMDPNKPVIIKAFHSFSEHNRLPLEIKESFDREQNEAEIEIITNPSSISSSSESISTSNIITSTSTVPLIGDNEKDLYHVTMNGDHQSESSEHSSESIVIPSSSTTSSSSSSSSSLSSQSIRSVPSSPKSIKTITNSLRQISIRILSQEEGYYLIAVKERNEMSETRPSNIVTVYLKSNLMIDNTTAMHNDDGLFTGPFRESYRTKPPSWIHVLIICILAALFLFIFVLIIICFTVGHNRRQQTKMSNEFDTNDSMKKGKSDQKIIMIDDDKLSKNKSSSTSSSSTSSSSSSTSPAKPFYLAQDVNGLMLNEKSQTNPNRSLSSVNTIDNLNGYHHLSSSNSSNNNNNNNDHNTNLLHRPNLQSNSPGISLSAIDSMTKQLGYEQLHSSATIVDGTNQSSSQTTSTILSSTNPTIDNNGLLKEMNVATLMPNSWDAKDLLDHWGKMQEAKLRHQDLSQHSSQNSQPIKTDSHSPSVISYDGSLAIDNYYHQQQQQQQQHQKSNSYLCQPAIVQQQQNEILLQTSSYQPQLSSSMTSINSPYSNASSIWQHQQQQQLQQQKQPNYNPYLHQNLNAQLNQHHHSKPSMPTTMSPIEYYRNDPIDENNLGVNYHFQHHNNNHHFNHLNHLHHHHHHHHHPNHTHPSNLHLSQPQSSMNFDDNGLPEYSVVRKNLPTNISQV